MGKVTLKKGDVFSTNSGDIAEIVEYINICKVRIKFQGRYTGEVVVRAGDLRKGEVKNPFAPSVAGVGMLGNLKGKKSDRAYVVWRGMLTRVYNPANEKQRKVYKDCEVCPEWLFFEEFKMWYTQQGKGLGWHVDKDLLVKGNRIYSPTTCTMLPHEINVFLARKVNQREGQDVGVEINPNGKKFSVYMRHGANKSYLGRYETLEEASFVYKTAKEDYAKQLALRYKSSLEERAYKALMSYEL